MLEIEHQGILYRMPTKLVLIDDRWKSKYIVGGFLWDGKIKWSDEVFSKLKIHRQGFYYTACDIDGVHGHFFYYPEEMANVKYLPWEKYKKLKAFI